MASREQQRESRERQKDSQGTDKYGSGPGSSGRGSLPVHSHTPEDPAGEMNPSAPTDSPEGPRNLASDRADSGTGLGSSRGEPARGETRANQGSIKKPSKEKHEAA